MESSKHRIEYLIDVYLSGEATDDERKQLESLYSSAILKTEYIDDLEVDTIHELRKEGLGQLIGGFGNSSQVILKPAGQSFRFNVCSK